MMRRLFFSIFDFLGVGVCKGKAGESDVMTFARVLIQKQEEERKKMMDQWEKEIEDSIFFIRKQLAETEAISIGNIEMIAETRFEVRAIANFLNRGY